MDNSDTNFTKTNNAQKHILLCEDHILNATIMKKILECNNYIVDYVDNGKKCVQIFKDSSPFYYDIIFMDIFMPVCSGIEASVTIRNLCRKDAKTTPIIAITAYMKCYWGDYKKYGINYIIEKPIDPDNLNFILKKYL